MTGRVLQRLCRMLGHSVPPDTRAVDLRALAARHVLAVRRLHKAAPTDPVLSAEYRRAEAALRASNPRRAPR